jgi:N-acetylneuraminic acid mutarotase
MQISEIKTLLCLFFSLLSSVECYDVRKGCWYSMEDLTVPRAGAHAVVENGKIYLSGGYEHSADGQIYSVSDTLVYNMKCNRYLGSSIFALSIIEV